MRNFVVIFLATWRGGWGKGIVASLYIRPFLLYLGVIEVSSLDNHVIVTCVLITNKRRLLTTLIQRGDYKTNSDVGNNKNFSLTVYWYTLVDKHSLLTTSYWYYQYRSLGHFPMVTTEPWWCVSSVFLTLDFFWKKNIFGDWVKEEEKRQKNLFFFTVRVVVRWIYHTTTRVSHVQSCTTSLSPPSSSQGEDLSLVGIETYGDTPIVEHRTVGVLQVHKCTSSMTKVSFYSLDITPESLSELSLSGWENRELQSDKVGREEWKGTRDRPWRETCLEYEISRVESPFKEEGKRVMMIYKIKKSTYWKP